MNIAFWLRAVTICLPAPPGGGSQKKNPGGESLSLSLGFITGTHTHTNRKSIFTGFQACLAVTWGPTLGSLGLDTLPTLHFQAIFLGSLWGGSPSTILRWTFVLFACLHSSRIDLGFTFCVTSEMCDLDFFQTPFFVLKLLKLPTTDRYPSLQVFPTPLDPCLFLCPSICSSAHMVALALSVPDLGSGSQACWHFAPNMAGTSPDLLSVPNF